jgi:hypothetical protein
MRYVAMLERILYAGIVVRSGAVAFQGQERPYFAEKEQT